MRDHDRGLLARVARLNDMAGQLVLAILGDRDRCDPEPARLRALGQTYTALGADLINRADELDGHNPPQVIDVQM